MSQFYYIEREIGIDAGHRVMTHGSKCQNIHGHRYRIVARCKGEILIPDGEQEAMVLDFGFLKELMMRHIDGPCDHGLIMYLKDPWLSHLLVSDGALSIISDIVGREGFYASGMHVSTKTLGKMYIVDFIPTAENLARHWFQLLELQVRNLSHGYATLDSVIVWETPNCKAEYKPNEE